MKLRAVGDILGLFISREGVSGRIPVETLTLDHRGVQLDKFYDKNIRRSVLLTSIESYHLAQKEGIEMEYGVLGENILMDFNPYLLDAGTQLKIGTAFLEISQYCTMCDHLTAIDPILPQLLAQDRGIFATVVKEGEVKKGDSIYLVKKEEEE
jgi:MOSC domain-containing protein YiiM